MCPNKISWCKGPGFFDQGRICIKCKGVDATHKGMALTKPPPASFPGAVESATQATKLSPSVALGPGLRAAPTGQRLASRQPSPRPNVATSTAPTLNVSASSGTALAESISASSPADPYARRPARPKPAGRRGWSR